MKKNYFTREVKVGIMAIVAIFVLYFGLNFLKGISIFTPVSYYYGSYENLGGLVPSTPVYVKGYKVGQVEKISYDFSKQKSFVIKISVSKDIKLPKGAKMELYDEGIMGGKAVQLVYAPITPTQAMYEPGDTIESKVGLGLMAQLSGDLVPKIESISLQADSLIRSVRVLVENKDLTKSLSSIEHTTANLAVSSSQLKKMMNNEVPRILSDVNVVTSDFKLISGNLKKIDYAATFASVNHTISNLSLITDKINNSEGTLGMLLNNKDLYINLSNTAASSDKLLIDLQKNPKRYVHFSLFGSKTK
ncbi:Mammalian cell entry related domain protein [Paludibacter propionicigenes WB4]|uniref:Mammalian cell entry related domain protein n=1 Tax=Paludibacter propionicigenes (strain DSM 17365 / JCM 13257 / WB4) TaxID=694427 RepID=E4T8S3_PALPW|nr:MlaD family protein [Paludibacter propionicigenes]ADQ81182.1 Mammalian cell entry related domain protein [Paludibacter propionicigenes WB4]